MKKILYTIGFLMMISVLLQPFMAQGQTQLSSSEEDLPFSAAGRFSKLARGLGLNPNADWGETFGTDDEADVGQNLYLVIYNKVQNQPVQKAGRNVAGTYGIPQSDLNVLLNGDYSKLVAERPAMTQAEATRIITEIQQNYKEERELTQLEAEIKSATEPSEIFVNGDLSDSGFDLINDLSQIEYLLFLKTNPTDVGGVYNPASEPRQPASPAGPSAVNETTATNPVERIPATPEEVSATSTEIQTGSTPAPNIIQTGSTPQTVPIGETVLSGTNTLSETPGQGFNPNSCFGNNKFAAALTAFENKLQSDSDLKDNSTSTNTATTIQGTTSGTNSGTTVPKGGTNGVPGADGSTIPSIVEASRSVVPYIDNTPVTAPVQPAPASNWKKDRVCAGPFCLFINFVMKPATTSYTDLDNCIACHAEKINDTLKKVISHSLTPSKAPGNLAEPGTCKKAMLGSFSSVSMNFYAIAMPVLTPMNDDLVFGPTIEEDWYNYCNAVAYPFTCRKKDPATGTTSSSYTVPPTIIDMVSKKELTNAADTATQDDIVTRINTAAAGYQATRNEELQTYSVAQGSNGGIETYQAVKVELDRMNYYFTNIRDLLHSLHEQVAGIPGPQACTDLNNKKECE